MGRSGWRKFPSPTGSHDGAGTDHSPAAISEKAAARLRQADSSYEKEGTYSLPIHSYSEVLYYNVDFFEENGLTVPTTWDEMMDTCEKIHEITGSPAFGWDNLAGSFMTLVNQFGGRYTDQSGNLYFAQEDEDVALEVLNLWQENVKKGIWRTAGEDMFFSGPFANEQIPMYIGDSVEASYIPAKNPDLNWATAPIPWPVMGDSGADYNIGEIWAPREENDPPWFRQANSPAAASEAGRQL